ncbi:LysR family transcriptional regulator ArgP [Agreia sp. COWG]|uniref:LysR family transcriptional regulator ArgP n=1 Tax=Agreia sp. COWG TaxID=2773266 RepID=UPI00351C10C7
MAFQTDHLDTLLALAEEGTFESAAARLHVTPSAISQRIKALEQSSGQVLVQRSNPVLMTDAGMVVLRLARQLALLHADAEAALHPDADRRGLLSISLAVNADSLATWFLSAVAGLSRSLGVVFDIHREDQEYTTALLRSGAVMAAVTSTATAVQGCSVVPLGVMRYRAVCSPAFAQAWAGGPGDPVDYGSAPAVTYDRKDTLQADFLAASGRTEVGSARHYVPSSSEFARAVVLGFGWALLPEQQCLAELQRGELVELVPGSRTDIALYWQRWNLTSPLLDALTNSVRSGAASSLHAL